MSDDRITVVIPVYNVEKYIGECMESIIHQSYENLEILAVNDGSTDGSGKILDAYALKDSRVQVLNKPNGGLSDARNFGIEHASGDFICFIDGDDTIACDYVRDLYEAMQKEGSDIAVCDMEYHYEDGRKEPSNGGEFAHTNAIDYPKLVLINNSACNKLYKTELFNDLLFPKGKLYEDLATIPALLYKAKLVSKVNLPLYYYRQRAGSIRHNINDGVFDIYEAINRNIVYVRSHGNEGEILNELQHLYIIHGLDAITLKIKDLDDSSSRMQYLKKNMEYLRKYDNDFMQDPYVKNASWKKKLIYHLLAKGSYKTVLKIYDR